ncbi:hypothetical protein [Thiomonas sp.]
MVVALGVYHGINPGMGWLLAVSNGMQARRGAAVHTLAMLATGGSIARLVYRYWGLRALRQSWFNLDLLWSVMLPGSGALATWAATR